MRSHHRYTSLYCKIVRNNKPLQFIWDSARRHTGVALLEYGADASERRHALLSGIHCNGRHHWCTNLRGTSTVHRSAASSKRGTFQATSAPPERPHTDDRQPPGTFCHVALIDERLISAEQSDERRKAKSKEDPTACFRSRSQRSSVLDASILYPRPSSMFPEC
ncbi:hypothetical protein KPH14_003754 [Odynerus spinipes]|uniref:Uncharacterized protein n=1 Tax=Odynerus spinipes TaxID=1348599 RepID=A0AAD9VUU0_9HYME|nr:hypothetical protein KPH14_003754 [Odynerus spinipes]